MLTEYHYQLYNLFFGSFDSWNPPPPYLRGGGVGPSENCGTRGVQNFLLQRRDKPEKGGWCRNGGGIANVLLLYSSITFTVCVEKVGFPLLLFGSSLFSVNHSSQDSHSCLYCTKTWYHLYISDPFW